MMARSQERVAHIPPAGWDIGLAWAMGCQLAAWPVWLSGCLAVWPVLPVWPVWPSGCLSGLVSPSVGDFLATACSYTF